MLCNLYATTRLGALMAGLIFALLSVAAAPSTVVLMTALAVIAAVLRAWYEKEQWRQAWRELRYRLRRTNPRFGRVARTSELPST
ncbi:hypothetical protein GCM10018962_23940 [Dactylosporangium matsuzakiense]